MILSKIHLGLKIVLVQKVISGKGNVYSVVKFLLVSRIIAVNVMILFLVTLKRMI